jgi:hypothetical protein
VSVVCLLCVVRHRSLRRANHPSRGILPIVVYLTECHREASILRSPWPIRAVAPGIMN